MLVIVVYRLKQTEEKFGSKSSEENIVQQETGDQPSMFQRARDTIGDLSQSARDKLNLGVENAQSTVCCLYHRYFIEN